MPQDKTLLDFAWDAANLAKTPSDQRDIEVPGCPDNLEWDEDEICGSGRIQTSYMARIKPRAPWLVLCLHFEHGA